MPNGDLLKQLFRNYKSSDNPGLEAVTQRIIAEERQKNHGKPHTSGEEAQGAATEFLLDHVGNQLLAGQPHLMVSATEAIWVVPVHLSYLPTGPIGSVGVVAIDDETGLVVAWTPIDQMKAASRMLRAGKELTLTQQFQTSMATMCDQANLCDTVA